MEILIKLGENEVRGPYTLEEVRAMVTQGELFATVDLAEVDGSGNWIPIKEIPGFSAPMGPVADSDPVNFPPDPTESIVEKATLWTPRLTIILGVTLTVLCIGAIVSFGPKLGSWLDDDEPGDSSMAEASVATPAFENDEEPLPMPGDEEEYSSPFEPSSENNGTDEPEGISPGLDAFELRVRVVPEGAGSVYDLDDLAPFDSKYVAGGTILSLKATSENNWMFLEWQLEDNSSVSETQTLSYTMPDHNLVMVARFKKNLARDLVLDELNAPATKVFVAFANGLEDPIEFLPGGTPPLPSRGNLNAKASWPKNPLGRIIKFTQESDPYKATKVGPHVIFENDLSSFSINPRNRTLQLASLPQQTKGEVPAYRLDVAIGLSKKFTLLVFDAAWLQGNGSRIVILGEPRLEDDAFHPPYGWEFHSGKGCRIWNENYEKYWGNMDRAATAAKSLNQHPGLRTLNPKAKDSLDVIKDLFGTKRPTGPLPYRQFGLRQRELIGREMQVVLDSFRGGETLAARDALNEFADNLNQANKSEFQDQPNAASWMHEILRGFLMQSAGLSYFDPKPSAVRRWQATEYLKRIPLNEDAMIKSVKLPKGIASKVYDLAEQYNTGSYSKKRTARTQLALYGVILVDNRSVAKVDKATALAAARKAWGKKTYLKFLACITGIKSQADQIDLDAPFRQSTWSSSETAKWSKAMDVINKGLKNAADTDNPADSKWTIRASSSDYNHLVWR